MLVALWALLACCRAAEQSEAVKTAGPDSETRRRGAQNLAEEMAPGKGRGHTVRNKTEAAAATLAGVGKNAARITQAEKSSFATVVCVAALIAAVGATVHYVLKRATRRKEAALADEPLLEPDDFS
jgi:hypothetical protein